MTETRKYESGFMTAEAIGSLLILAILLPILNNMYQVGVNTLRKKSVAEHFMTVQKAAHSYAKLYHSTLSPVVTETTGPTVTFATLKSTKCLPARFSDTNAWGQSYEILARKDKTTGKLAMVVITVGGRGASAKDPSFANIMLPETAAMAKAGFVSTGLIGASQVLRGAYGAWEVPLASMGLNATPGHLGAISTLSDDDLAQDFLYRVAVPGQPELNAMQTNLDMTVHSINNIKSIDFESQNFASMTNFCTSPEDEGRTFLDAKKGLYLCRDGAIRIISDTGNSLLMQESTIASNYALIKKPICPQGTNTHPEIFVTPSIVSTGAQSPTTASVQAWATNFSADEWQVKLRVLTAENKWIYPSANYAKMIVFTTCARN